jgi:NitT/TauT family transport system substrate-binding protein
LIGPRFLPIVPRNFADCREEAMAGLGRRRVLQGLGAAGLAGVGGVGLDGAPALAQPKAMAASATFGPAGAIYAASMVADVLGFAKEEGVDLKLQITDGGAKSRQVLAAGEAMFGHGDSSHPLQISNRGKPARMLYVTESVCSYANMVVRKDLYDQGITTPEKLAGWKRPNGAKPIVAATAIGSGTWIYGTFIFESLGAGDNINWVSGGGTSTMLGGLQSKQFDAIMALPAWQYDAEANGWGKRIYDVLDKAAWAKAFGGPLPTTAIYALKTTIDQHADVTQATINATYKAMQWMKANASEEIFKRIGPKYLQDLDPAAAKREFDYYKAAWHYSGTFDAAEYKNGERVWFRDGTDIKPIAFADAIDARFIDNARKKFG